MRSKRVVQEHAAIEGERRRLLSCMQMRHVNSMSQCYLKTWSKDRFDRGMRTFSGDRLLKGVAVDLLGAMADRCRNFRCFLSAGSAAIESNSVSHMLSLQEAQRVDTWLLRPPMG